MPNIGFSELIVILLILILVFGASRLPALGEGMGKAIRSFKRGVAHDEKIEVTKNEPKRMESPASARANDDNITDAEIVEDKKS
jgi:sec-independent protein translocase protein TatA